MAKGKAENLDDVLEVARSRKQSGMLTLEHTQGGRVEEGEVFLQAGQPIYARVGHLNGQDALNWLLRWRNIYFSIAPEESTSPASTPATGKDENPATNLAPSPQRTLPAGAGSVGQVRGRVRSDRSGSTSGDSYALGIEWLVPQKRGVEREVLSLPLTRRQRFIYFLVDGRRTVSDLSRCTGKNIQEIELILNELREQGLVAV